MLRKKIKNKGVGKKCNGEGKGEKIEHKPGKMH